MPIHMIFNLGEIARYFDWQWTWPNTKISICENFRIHTDICQRNLSSNFFSFSLKFVNSASASWSASVGCLDLVFGINLWLMSPWAPSRGCALVSNTQTRLQSALPNKWHSWLASVGCLDGIVLPQEGIFAACQNGSHGTYFYGNCPPKLIICLCGQKNLDWILPNLDLNKYFKQFTWEGWQDFDEKLSLKRRDSFSPGKYWNKCWNKETHFLLEKKNLPIWSASS